jgi:putative phage-type endonuclease
LSFTRICGTDDRKAWLAARRSGVGASEAPSLFGCGFRSALEVYMNKLEEGEPEDVSTPLTRWGQRLEAVILDAFAEETGRRIEHGGQLLRSREWPWMLATLDAEQVCPKRATPGTVEAKNTRYLAGEWDDGEIPRRIMIQMQQQLAVTGRDWGSVAVLRYGSDFQWRDVERDDAFIREVLVPAGEEFWRRVTERRPCPPDGTESARAAIRRLYPDPVEGKSVDLGGELIPFDAELQMLKADRATMDKRIAQIEDSIKMAIGDAEVGHLLNGTSYTYQSQSRAEYTVKATTYRVLRRIQKRRG